MVSTIVSTHGFRFICFPRAEPCLHGHANHVEGEAKLWLEPQIAVVQNIGLSGKTLWQAQALIKEHEL